MKPDPKFHEMAKVSVAFPHADPVEGYVIGYQRESSRWIYQISFPDPDRPGESYENYAPEEWLREIS